MRAAVTAGVGQAMTVEDLAEPRPRSGEVLVEVAACGVCHSDLHVLRGEIPFPLPAVLGHEVAGRVLELGPGMTGLRCGDPVVCSFIMPCGSCRRCSVGTEELCETFFSMNRLGGVLYDGETRLYRRNGDPIAMYSMGGLAERCVVPATAVCRVPDGAELADVATVGCSTLTAYGAVRTVADLHPGDRVAVVAAGGVGLAIVQMCALFGASQIIAIDLADDKLEAAQALGATAVVNARCHDPATAVAELTAGRGVDVAFEAFGSPTTFACALNLVGDGGSVVVAGIGAQGAQGQLDLMRLPRRKLRILGTYGGRPRAHLPLVLDLIAQKRLTPGRAVTARYTLDEVGTAYRRLGEGAIVGRALIEMGGAR